MERCIIDFHAHILPNADHGSNSVRVSQSQIKYSKIPSVDCIVATPHFYPHVHRLESFVKRRDRAFDELKCAISSHSDMPLIIKGAEVLVCPGIHKLVGIDRLCIDGTRTLLLELPFCGFENSYIESVEVLLDQGFDVVMAHVDRYEPKDIEELVKVGAKLQINVDSLSHTFKKPQHLYKWISDGSVVALGSDIHMKNKRAYKNFLKVKEKLGEDFDRIMEKSCSLIKMKQQ